MYKCIGIAVIITAIGFGTTTHAAALTNEWQERVSENRLSAQNQAACISGRDGVTLSENPDMRIIPASVSKIYTTDWVLSKMSPEFRYVTNFYLVGTTLYINGDGDPHFVIEHLEKVLREIHDSKRVIIDTIVFSPNFYFNWKLAAYDVVTALRTALKANPLLPVSKNVGIVPAAVFSSNQGSHFTFASAPLPALLKQMNNYSTNPTADTLFNRLGGTTAFSEYIKDTYGVDEETIRFETGSGLRGNYTTCNLTLKVLKHLTEKVENLDLQLTDIMTVPKIDEGVLQKRFIETKDTGSIVAKSGYLNYHHALAGVINTKREPTYFALFTYFPDMRQDAYVKHMLDLFVSDMMDHYENTARSFSYTPELARLEDTKIVQE